MVFGTNVSVLNGRRGPRGPGPGSVSCQRLCASTLRRRTVGIFLPQAIAVWQIQRRSAILGLINSVNVKIFKPKLDPLSLT